MSSALTRLIRVKKNAFFCSVVRGHGQNMLRARAKVRLFKSHIFQSFAKKGLSSKCLPTTYVELQSFSLLIALYARPHAHVVQVQNIRTVLSERTYFKSYAAFLIIPLCLANHSGTQPIHQSLPHCLILAAERYVRNARDSSHVWFRQNKNSLRSTLVIFSSVNLHVYTTAPQVLIPV